MSFIQVDDAERLVVWYGPSNGVELSAGEDFTDTSEIGENLEKPDHEVMIDDHFKYHNKIYLDDIEQGRLWKTEITEHVDPREEGKQYFELNVTGSRMSHLWLNPGVYRTVRAISDVGNLKVLMGFTSEDEELISNAFAVMREHPFVIASRNNFMNLRKISTENEVESFFDTLVSVICLAISSKCIYGGKVKYSVGGLLVDPLVAYRGITDTIFVNEHRDFAFATEIKTLESWVEDPTDKWYFGCKSSQAFGALYATHSPTFLLNQHEAKLFLIGQDKNGIDTFPSKDNTIGTGSEVFLEIICLCLLLADKKAPRAFQSQPVAPLRVPNTSSCIKAPASNSVLKPPATSASSDGASGEKENENSNRRGLTNSNINLANSVNQPSLLTQANMYELSKSFVSRSKKCQMMFDKEKKLGGLL